MSNVNNTAVTNRIKAAGPGKVRIEQDQSTGLCQIEVLTESNWVSIAGGLPRSTAESLVTSASSKLICG